MYHLKEELSHFIFHFDKIGGFTDYKKEELLISKQQKLKSNFWSHMQDNLQNEHHKFPIIPLNDASNYTSLPS